MDQSCCWQKLSQAYLFKVSFMQGSIFLFTLCFLTTFRASYNQEKKKKKRLKYLFMLQTESISIIHGFDGSSFQQYCINQDFEEGYSSIVPFCFVFCISIVISIFMIRLFDHYCSFVLSKAHKYRLQCYYTEPGLLLVIISFFFFPY